MELCHLCILGLLASTPHELIGQIGPLLDWAAEDGFNSKWPADCFCLLFQYRGLCLPCLHLPTPLPK